MSPCNRVGAPLFVAHPVTVESVGLEHDDTANSVSSTALGAAMCARRADQVGWNSTRRSRAARRSPHSLPPPVPTIQFLAPRHSDLRAPLLATRQLAARQLVAGWVARKQVWEWGTTREALSRTVKFEPNCHLAEPPSDASPGGVVRTHRAIEADSEDAPIRPYNSEICT